ncbi:unnamed protein product [Schistosoma mattheei]|uniref:Uncharacterized protein n=1 Tax=Schistosoma mattheei TaxID=31246 RepID=A0A183PLG7_9TREM|nr:unnamed protein product [Schistosoma mattheei]
MEEHMELKTTFNQYQRHNLQYQRQDSQFYYTELKSGELQQPPSRRYKYLLIVVYARYSTATGLIPSATAFCGRERTSFQLKRKLGRDDGNGQDVRHANHQTASRGKP